MNNPHAIIGLAIELIGLGLVFQRKRVGLSIVTAGLLLVVLASA